MAQSPQLKHSSPTSPDPQDFRLDATPAMRADNVVSGDHWRIGLITDSLVHSNGPIPAYSRTARPRPS